jgi:hypothetical protein
VPIERAFASPNAPDVALRLGDDSTHWWRIRQARLEGDSIIGLAKVGGRLRRVAVPRDSVRAIVVREPDRVASGELMQFALVAGFIGTLAFLVHIAPTGWSL